MGGEGHVHGLAERLGMDRLPVCPRMRLAGTSWYAVDGFCVQEASPGWLMVPSIDLFRSYCTTARFSQCPWFGSTGDNTPQLIDQRSGITIRADV